MGGFCKPLLLRLDGLHLSGKVVGLHEVERKHAPLPAILHFIFLSCAVLLQLHLRVYHTSCPKAFALDDFESLRNARPLVGKELISFVAVYQRHMGKTLENVRCDAFFFFGDADGLHLLNKFVLEETVKFSKGCLVALMKVQHGRMCADGGFQIFHLQLRVGSVGLRKEGSF